MGYLTTWKILEEIVIEFRKKNLAIPEHIMNDLRAAKTLINLIDTGECQDETKLKVEQYLSTVEAYLVTEAQKIFPSERINEWLKKLETSSSNTYGSQAKQMHEVRNRFVPGLPRDQKWIRVKPIVSLPQEKLEHFAKEAGLSVKAEEDGYLTVYGDATSIRGFVKLMTEQKSKET
ncbi:MAG TPA: DUF2096 family protein [Candidatus Sulfotelmatobacter sp.]|nr:DUF2096 family protein [Candidatus Sulfotelmatobacter sp.]